MSKYSLGEFIKQIRGVSYKPADVTNSENGTPILRANNIQDDGLVFDDLVYIVDKKVGQEQLLQKGDIVICASSGSKNLVGKAATFNEFESSVSFGAFCKVVRVKNIADIESDYIRFYFHSKYYREQISANSSGSNINNIKTEDIDGLTINIPSISEQKEAVFLFERYFSAISAKKKELSALDELVKSRFIEMFGELDLSAQKSNWERLSELGTIYTGTTPSTSDESNWDGNILWITPAEMNEESFFISDTVRKITEKGAKSKSLTQMPIGTVLLSTRAPIGKVGIVAKPMTCNQGFKNFYCPDKLNSIYLYVLLKYNTHYLNSIGTGTTFKEISKTTCGNIRIPVPAMDKQNEFADFVKLIDKSKFIVQQQIKDLEELLDSKMDEYFR